MLGRIGREGAIEDDGVRRWQTKGTKSMKLLNPWNLKHPEAEFEHEPQKMVNLAKSRLRLTRIPLRDRERRGSDVHPCRQGTN